MIDVSHELGHTAGIAHITADMHCGDNVTPSGLQPKSVMKTGGSGQRWAYINCGGVLPPYSDDVRGVNAVFPGGGK